MEQKEVEACVFTSIHNTAYFSNYVYCSMGRPYGLVVGHAGKGTTISSLVDGGHALRRYQTVDMILCTIDYRSYGENVVYTDWKKDNYFRAIKVPILFTVQCTPVASQST